MEEKKGLRMAPEESRYSLFQHWKCEFFPCHKTDHPETLNCLFCCCPLYTLDSACGGNCAWLPNGIKDCGGGLAPHGERAAAVSPPNFRNCPSWQNKLAERRPNQRVGKNLLTSQGMFGISILKSSVT